MQGNKSDKYFSNTLVERSNKNTSKVTQLGGSKHETSSEIEVTKHLTHKYLEKATKYKSFKQKSKFNLYDFDLMSSSNRSSVSSIASQKLEQNAHVKRVNTDKKNKNIDNLLSYDKNTLINVAKEELECPADIDF